MKHSKIFLTVIVSIFSLLFIDDIKAYTFYGVELNDDFFNKGWELLEGKTWNELVNSTYSNSTWNTPLLQENFPFVECEYANNSSNTNPRINCYFLMDYSYFSQSSSIVTVKSSTLNNFPYAPGFTYYINTGEYVHNKSNNFSISKSGFSQINFDVYNGETLLKSKSFDYNPNSKKIFNINFHLNGGTIEDDINDIVFNEDFSVSLYGTEIENFIRGLVFKKSGMVFEGMYYDNTYNNPFNINDTITSDIDLYVKWTFASVDDFLKNVSFNEHIFDTNYEYAIISKGNHNDDIYFGLDFANYSLEIFEYRPDLNSYKDGSSVCLTPVYSKDGKYYYNVNTLYTSNYEIFVLPRSVFDNNIESDYSFLLTDNAYVTYTNDLKDTVIVDKNGNELHTNLKDSYELSQSYLNEYKNADSNFNIMKKYLNELKSINSVWNECFDLFYSSLPTICKSFLIFVFNVIMILIFLKLVGWK